MPELAWMNGKFIPINEAHVSIEDRGFQFADGVYEVVVFHGDRPLMLEEHLDRLRRSCQGVDLDIDVDSLNLVPTIHDGVRKAGFADTMVYLQITRGAMPRNHVVTGEVTPTVVMTFKAKPVVDPKKRASGIAVMSTPDIRWAHCNIKSIALLPNVLIKNRACRMGFDDAIFVGDGNRVHEACASNVFAIKDNILHTPTRDHTILPGITRTLVLQCAREIQLSVREAPITLDDLLGADEVFLSSTTIDVLPVVRIDSHIIAGGKPGHWTEKLYEQMQAVIHETAPGVIRA